MATVTALRLPEDLRKELDRLASAEGKDRSEVVREILRRGIAERKLERALEAYQRGKATLVKASHMAGLTVWEMLEVFRDRKITIQYGVDDLEEDLRTLRGLR
ncbi:MAG TPA: UPF0175 family protein [Thermoplasmata archaeon]|nr:UPF0175 family protein [Thermoplasmata archaeon]